MKVLKHNLLQILLAGTFGWGIGLSMTNHDLGPVRTRQVKQKKQLR